MNENIKKGTPVELFKWLQNYSDENSGEIIITDGRIFITDFEKSQELNAEQLAEIWRLQNPEALTVTELQLKTKKKDAMKFESRMIISKAIKEAKDRIHEQTGITVNIAVIYSMNEAQAQTEKLLLDMCACWGVTAEWLRVPSRAEDRPVMRKLFWMAAKHNYPQVTHKAMAILAGVSNHGTALKGMLRGRDWKSVNDPLVMQYYKPVAHLMNF